MLLKTINRVPIIKKMMSKILEQWVEKKSHQFIDFLSKDSKILDLGSGNCLVAHNLKKKGYHIVPIDVKDLSVIKNIKPIIYDGIRLPFKKNTFTTVLLLTVLHHTDDPENIILESKKVAKNIIIIEDTYNNLIQKIITQLMDLIVNLGHSKMTYQNKSESSWENLFAKHNLKIVSKKGSQFYYSFNKLHIIYKEKSIEL